MIEIRQKEVLRYLGYRRGNLPDAELLQKIAVCESALQAAAEPRSTYLRLPLQITGEDSFQVDGHPFVSRDLTRNLQGCREVFLFAATLGIGVDRLIRRATATKMSDAVIYQAAGAEMIESYCNRINEELRQQVLQEGLYLKPRFSPGYGDMPLTAQPVVCRMLDSAKRIGLTLTDSLIMMPSKSVTAFIGITPKPQKNHMKDCRSCKKTNCAFRAEDADQGE